MAHNTIEVRGAVKRYGAIEAVKGVDLSIQGGEVFGLIGHNGAGKSTLFKLMLGLLPATAGDIHFDGSPVRGERFRQVRRHLGYLPENVVFYDNLSGSETLEFFAALKGVAKRECALVLERVGLANAAARRVRDYSKGMRQRLGFAQALLGNPRWLFLDEPTNGLDPEGIRSFYRILREQREQGTTVVLTSHILAEIQERVDRLAIMKSGRIHALGTVASLREQMNLPLWFEWRMVRSSADAVRAALAGIGEAAIETQGERVTLHCPRTARMSVFAALATLGGQVADLGIREPSLEDVFLGYSG